jgi:hypothetical protein
MAMGDMAPLEPQATPLKVQGPVTTLKPKMGEMPPSTLGVEAKVPDNDPMSGLKEGAMSIGAKVDKAWDFIVPQVAGALRVIEARVGLGQQNAADSATASDPGNPALKQTPEGKWVDPEAAKKAIDAHAAKDPKGLAQRKLNDTAVDVQVQKRMSETSDPLTGPGHLYALLGWHPEESPGVKKTNDFTAGFDAATEKALEFGAKKAEENGAGWITGGEATDLARIAMGFMAGEGVLKGGVKAFGWDKTKALQDDMTFLSENAKYKAARGSKEPLKEAAQEMQWSGVQPEHQAALEAEVQKYFAEKEAPKPAADSSGLVKLAESWNKDPELRTPEEHEALKKYFKHDDAVPEDAEAALKAVSKPLEELTEKDKGLLRKYGPTALAGAAGLAIWNQADDSDNAKTIGAMAAMIAVGIPLEREAVHTLGEIRDTMTGPSLKFIETLPADTKVVSKQQILEYLNKPGVAGPEKLLLQKIADEMPEKAKITPQKLVESLAPTLAKWELVPEVTQKYATHGLPAIDRFNPRGAETVLYRMAGDEGFEIPKHIEGKRATDHFPEAPGTFGHIRRFVEDGVKHVVELQSDAFQQLSRSAKTPEDAAAWKGNVEILRAELKRLFNSAGVKLTEERILIRQGVGTNIFRAKNLVAQLLDDIADHTVKYDAEATRWARGWADRVRDELTLDGIDEVIKHAQSGMKTVLARAEKKLEGHDPSKEWGAVSERLKPMAKYYSRRLVREELADSFRQREEMKKGAERMRSDPQQYADALKAYDKAIDGHSKVRFASAETVAKVEGWPALELDEIKETLKKAKTLLAEFENGDATVEDLERFDHTPESLREEIAKSEATIEWAKKKQGAAPEATLYAPEHQGIFDRYKKETEQFLRSIGGTVVKDKDGHEWFEVPVQNKGLGLGPRAHMAGSIDPHMLGLMAGAGLGLYLGYKYHHSLGDSILGAVLGAGAVAGGRAGYHKVFTKSLAGTEAVKAAVKELSDMLYTTVQGSKAQGLDMLDYVKRGLPKSYAAHAEAIANHMDNPRKFPLSGEAKRLLDDVIRPIQNANHAMVKALKALGIETEDIIPGRGARRYFQGTSKGLAGLGQELEKGGRVGGSRTLSTRVAGSTDQAFHSYKTISGQEFLGKLGKDGVVDIYNNGAVVGKGKWNPRTQEMDYIGQKFKAARPKMELVEQHTGLKYEREPLLAEMDANLRLKSALANAYFLENFKKMPGFSNFALKPEPHEVVPEGWKSVPQLPAMRGYKFEPRIAEALEDFAADQAKGFWHYAAKVNRIFVGSMFWTPFLHVGNVAVHALQEKGVVGLMKNLPVNLRTSVEAYREVSNMGPKYRAYLRDGGSFMYPDRLLGEFNGNLLKALGKDPQAGGMIAKAFGYANPIEMTKRLYKISGDSLWKWNDVFMMQGYLEKEARGMQRDEAMRKTEAHVPNYRIPSRVLDSRALAAILSENGPLSFARYDYGRLKSYGETIRDLVGKDHSLADRGHALDQLAMLGVIMVAYDQLGDKVAKWLTGNDQASMARLGSATIPQMIMDAWSGEADKRTPVVNLFHLSPVFELLPQVVANKDLYTGQDWAKTPGDAAMKTAQQFSPVKLASDVVRERNPTSPASVFWAQIGIKDPSPDSVEKKEKRKEKRLQEREAE